MSSTSREIRRCTKLSTRMLWVLTSIQTPASLTLWASRRGILLLNPSTLLQRKWESVTASKEGVVERFCPIPLSTTAFSQFTNLWSTDERGKPSQSLHWRAGRIARTLQTFREVGKNPMSTSSLTSSRRASLHPFFTILGLRIPSDATPSSPMRFKTAFQSLKPSTREFKKRCKHHLETSTTCRKWLSKSRKTLLTATKPTFLTSTSWVRT